MNFEFKQCTKCKRHLPEYLFQQYSQLASRMICPVCARRLVNKMRKRPEGTPFDNPDDQELWNEASEFLKSIKYNVGGCMINPPRDCAFAKQYPGSFGNEDGGVWVDLQICGGGFNICPKSKNCARYLKWKNMSSKERLLELLNNGVFLPAEYGED